MRDTLHRAQQQHSSRLERVLKLVKEQFPKNHNSALTWKLCQRLQLRNDGTVVSLCKSSSRLLLYYSGCLSGDIIISSSAWFCFNSGSREFVKWKTFSFAAAVVQNQQLAVGKSDSGPVGLLECCCHVVFSRGQKRYIASSEMENLRS